MFGAPIPVSKDSWHRDLYRFSRMYVTLREVKHWVEVRAHNSGGVGKLGTPASSGMGILASKELDSF
jgi:hypothetical protein